MTDKLMPEEELENAITKLAAMRRAADLSIHDTQGLIDLAYDAELDKLKDKNTGQTSDEIDRLIEVKVRSLPPTD